MYVSYYSLHKYHEHIFSLRWKWKQIFQFSYYLDDSFVVLIYC